LTGDWRTLARSVHERSPRKGKPFEVVDCGALAAWDARLAAELWALGETLRTDGATLRLSAAPAGLVDLLALAGRGAPAPDADASPQARKTSRTPGDAQPGSQGWITVAFVGEVLIASGRLLTGRARLRAADVVAELDRTGPRSVPIVLLTCGLVGLMLAYMGGAQLGRIGAQRYLADVVTVGMVRELAGLMTGVILAGRLGAGFAAQLAAMNADEEIDALRALGVDPIVHLVMPRLVAMVLVAPALIAFGALAGIGAHQDCVTVIAPATLGKEERNDAELALRFASRFGLRVIFKRGLLADLRTAHSPEELARMERAIAITRAGHDAVARAVVPGVSERDVQTQLEYAFYAAGATGLSYPSIVGSGPNGAVLHWDKNSRLLKDGDLVVVDAAAEYGRYAADITRTYPVSGRFTSEQAQVYRAVYQAQEDIFAAIKPGVSMAQLQHVAEQSLRRAGFLADFIHGFGHFVGLDVHDAGDYEKPLPAGAVITVEPGVYLPAKGFGVRIEDEVLITPGGYRLLSPEFPRKLEDVEAWVQHSRH